MTSDKLYGLAFEYKKTRLWKVLGDMEVFAVKLSADRIGYISIMGQAGGYCALGLFIGDKGFNSFRTIAATDPETLSLREYHEHILQHECLQCAFEGKDQLSEEEREEAKVYARSHGVRISGKNAYPHFMKYQPNCCPWHLQTEQEVEDLCEALAAAIEMGRLLEERTADALGLRAVDGSTKEILMLEHQEQVWEMGKTLLPIEKPKEVPAPKISNEIAAARLRKVKKAGIWECEIIRFPQPVQNSPEEVPVFPALLLAVESSTGYILQVPPVENYENEPEELLNLFVEALLKEEIRPIEIKARDERMYFFAKDLCDKLKAAISIEEELPSLDEAEDDFMQRFSMGGGDNVMDDLNTMLDEVLELDESQFSALPVEIAEFLKNVKEQGILPEDIQVKIDRIFGLEEEYISNQCGQKRALEKSSGPARSYVISVSLGAGCYRHIKISGDCTLMELHSVILKAFEFCDDHAHAFFMDNVVWSQADSYYVPGIERGDRTTDLYTLEQAGLDVGKKFKYVFDFGDEWTFQCKVLRIEAGAAPVPTVIKGKGDAPDQYGYW